MSLWDLRLRRIAHDAARERLPAVRLAPVLPAWAVLAGAAERAMRRSRGPQSRPPSVFERLLALANL